MTKEELEQLARGERLDGEAYSRQVLARDLLAAQDELEKARTGIRQVADTVKVHAQNIERLQSDLQAIRGQIQPAHSSPYRALTKAEIAKLQALCDSREYLYWWDMGSALLTLRLADATEPLPDDGPPMNVPQPTEPIWLAAPILKTTRFTGSGVRVSGDKPELGEAWAVAGPYTLSNAGKVDELLAKAPPAPPVSTVAMAGSTIEDHLPRDPATGLPLRVERDEVAALLKLTRLDALEEVYEAIDAKYRIANAGEGEHVWGQALAIVRSLAMKQ